MAQGEFFCTTLTLATTTEDSFTLFFELDGDLQVVPVRFLLDPLVSEALFAGSDTSQFRRFC